MYSKICKPEFWCKSKEIKRFRYKTCASKTSLSLLSFWNTFESLLEILIGSQWNRHRKACKYNQLQGLFYHWCVKPGFTTDNYSVDKLTNFYLARHVFKQNAWFGFRHVSRIPEVLQNRAKWLWDFDVVFLSDSPENYHV